MMQKLLLIGLCCLMVVTCSKIGGNPFFEEWKTPFSTPPYERIQLKHYMPAFEKGMEQQQKEIEVIVDNADAPTFENTIEAMEKSGELLTKVSNVFYNLNSAHTSDAMQAIAKDVAPLLSKHRDDILLNEKLFERVEAVYQQKDQLDLSEEGATLLEKYYKNFTRNGANLDEEQKNVLRDINKELS
ncbi:MAG: peptidase M3, partial [bacterium]|nr:peptidase M3 [bacterium]